MGQEQGSVLERGARVLGLAVTAVLAAAEIAWVVRDFRNAGVHDTLWIWFGQLHNAQGHPLLGTTVLDPVLIGILAGVLVAAFRPVGATAFASAAAVIVLYRVPTIWIFNSGWTDGVPLRGRLMLTAVVEVAGAIALWIISLAGRRPAGPGTGLEAPVRPRTVPSVWAGNLLMLAAGASIAWQIYWINHYGEDKFPRHFYWHLFTGEGTITSLLATPPAWSGWVTAALCLESAILCYVRPPLARPLGFMVGWTLALVGASTIGLWSALHQFLQFDHASTETVLSQITAIYETGVGVLVILLLLPGARRTDVEAAHQAAPASQFSAWDAGPKAPPPPASPPGSGW